MGSSLKSNSMGRPNDQGWEISPRYARKREEIFITVQFTHSILCDIVYVCILCRIMNSKWFLKVTHNSYTSTLNVAFLKALSLVTCFLKILVFTYTCIFHLHINVIQFLSWLQLCLSTCFLNNPRTKHPTKSIPFLLLLWAKPSARPCWVTMWEGEHGFCLCESLIITCK